MKFKEIKPGMVIRLTTGKEENIMINYLREQKYKILQTLEARGEGRPLWCKIGVGHVAYITSNHTDPEIRIGDENGVEFSDLVETEPGFNEKGEGYEDIY